MEALALLSAASISSDLLRNLSFSRNTIIVRRAVMTGFATAIAASRPFIPGSCQLLHIMVLFRDFALLPRKPTLMQGMRETLWI